MNPYKVIPKIEAGGYASKEATLLRKLRLLHCPKVAAVLTCTTFDTFCRVNDMRFLHCSADRSHRTHSGTFGTALTQFRINLECGKRLTLASRAFSVRHVGNVLVPES